MPLGAYNTDGPECENSNFSEVWKRRISLSSVPQKQSTESPGSQPFALETLVKLLTQSPGTEHQNNLSKHSVNNDSPENSLLVFL